MDALNTQPPSIEPRASGHITEQIAMIQQILDAGMAYQINGSVYFDVEKYDRQNHYGILSRRVLEDLQANTRTLDGQDDKRSPFDFALWKKASPEHIMHWPSPWSEGFPGWHLECSVMSSKYLGQVFDIHGGGMDLLFPHHECELAQNTVTRGENSVRYWMHNNLITINGQKMGKSLGNFITLEQLFEGTHPLLSQPFHPVTIRFFILQAHYRGPLDFSNDALLAAEKGLQRLLRGRNVIKKMNVSPDCAPSAYIQETREKIYEALCDDLNTPVALAALFDLVSWIHTTADGKKTVCPEDIKELEHIYDQVVDEILGLKEETDQNRLPLVEGLIEMILDLRKQARTQKNWEESDRIRNRLSGLGVQIKDTKDGTDWEI